MATAISAAATTASATTMAMHHPFFLQHNSNRPWNNHLILLTNINPRSPKHLLYFVNWKKSLMYP
jgi:hypothetical protein